MATLTSETITLDDQRLEQSAALLADFLADRSQTDSERVADVPTRKPIANETNRRPPRRVPMRRRWSLLDWIALLIFLSGMIGSGYSLYKGETTRRPVIRPIQDFRVGQAARSENPTGELDLSLGDHVEPQTWRHLILKAPKEDGSHADVELLRPLWWLTERDAKVGAFIDIDVPHCGIEGEAEVLAINPCPPIQPPQEGYRTVIGTFRHHNAEVIDLYVEGLDQPIGTTPNHPFWSEDRKEFVRADELQPGEALKDLKGNSACVKNYIARKSLETVFNLEVFGTHAYQVSDLGLVVHNSNLLPECKWGNPTSRNAYGHTFSNKHKHSAKARLNEVQQRARVEGHQIGQWTDDKKAAVFLHEEAKKNAAGARLAVDTVDLPERLGNAVHIDGRVTTADKALIRYNPDGTIKTAYPIDSSVPTSATKALSD